MNKDIEQSYQETAKSVNLDSDAMLVHAVGGDQSDSSQDCFFVEDVAKPDENGNPTLKQSAE